MKTKAELEADLKRYERVRLVMIKHSEHISRYEWDYIDNQIADTKNQLEELKALA